MESIVWIANPAADLRDLARNSLEPNDFNDSKATTLKF